MDDAEVVGDEQVADPELCLQSLSRSSTCAWIDTSSAETGSSHTITSRVGAERPGDRHALALAAGQLQGARSAVLVLEADELEQLAHPRTALGARGAVARQAVGQDLRRRSSADRTS